MALALIFGGSGSILSSAWLCPQICELWLNFESLDYLVGSALPLAQLWAWAHFLRALRFFFQLKLFDWAKVCRSWPNFKALAHFGGLIGSLLGQTWPNDIFISNLTNWRICAWLDQSTPLLKTWPTDGWRIDGLPIDFLLIDVVSLSTNLPRYKSYW